MENLKRSLITRGVDDFHLDQQIRYTHFPKPGDVAVFEVLDIGKHNRIQGIDEKNKYIFPGDRILATFGNRYATSQLVGYVPEEIHTQYHLLGQGGAVGIMASIHSSLEDIGPTTLQLIGFATHAGGEVINTKFLQRQPTAYTTLGDLPFQTILSVGSSMDSGKTTTAGYMTMALKRAGYRAAYIKLTGTVYSKDKDFVEDCGADLTIDFSDFGFPSTFMCSIKELLTLFASSLQAAAAARPDFVVIEIADGLFQRETKLLLEHPLIKRYIDHVVLSCADSLSVQAGLHQLLPQFGPRIRAVSGLFTASPPLIDEVKAHCSLPILTLEGMMQEGVIQHLPQSVPGEVSRAMSG